MTPLGIGIAARYLDLSGSRDCLCAAGPLLVLMTQKGVEGNGLFLYLRLSPRLWRMQMQALIVMALRRYDILRLA